MGAFSAFGGDLHSVGAPASWWALVILRWVLAFVSSSKSLEKKREEAHGCRSDRSQRPPVVGEVSGLERYPREMEQSPSSLLGSEENREEGETDELPRDCSQDERPCHGSGEKEEYLRLHKIHAFSLFADQR